MQAELNALHERDPEFYAYLKQTDSNLLGFTLSGSEEEDEEEEDEVEEAQAPDVSLITKRLVQCWQQFQLRAG